MFGYHRPLKACLQRVLDGARQAQQQLGGRSFSPLLVPAGAEFNGGAGADVVGGGGQTRDTYKDDFLDILESDVDKQLK